MTSDDAQLREDPFREARRPAVACCIEYDLFQSNFVQCFQSTRLFNRSHLDVVRRHVFCPWSTVFVAALVYFSVVPNLTLTNAMLRLKLVLAGLQLVSNALLSIVVIASRSVAPQRLL